MYFDALFMCLFRFVVFGVTFNGLCCSLLSRIHLRLRTKVGKLVQMNLYYTLKLFLLFADIKFGS